MGKFQLLSIILIVGVSALIYRAIDSTLSDQQFTQTLPDFYWGPKAGEKDEDISIKPYKINVNQKILDSLKRRLQEEIESKRFTPPLESIGYEYGINSDYLQTIVKHWLTKYDWRSREKLLNSYPHFLTKIAGLNIHFQHVKSENKNGKYAKTRPLLLIHGWPGSFVEFQKIIPMLTDPKDSDVNFEVIIPSLPGFGFSDGAVRPGLGPVEIGQIFVKLMKRLGHNKFYIQGGDWGAAIGNLMTKTYPENVVAYHSNFCLSNHPRSTLKGFIAAYFPSYFYTPEEAERFLPSSKFLIFLIQETGYMHIQATKPDTVGVGLSHSPIGLAAYLLEKFTGWTNADYLKKKDGGLTIKFNLDDLLDNVMIYWSTNSITTSMRIYSEYFSIRERAYELDRVPSLVPMACLVPRYEQYIGQPKSIMQDSFHNIISYNYASDGGHFFALEHPDILAEDVLQFVRLTEKMNLFDLK